MQYREAKALNGEFVVVETEDGTAWIGVAQVSRKAITIRTGYSGRPPVIPLSEVDLVTPADQHPDLISA